MVENGKCAVPHRTDDNVLAEEGVLVKDSHGSRTLWVGSLGAPPISWQSRMEKVREDSNPQLSSALAPSSSREGLEGAELAHHI